MATSSTESGLHQWRSRAIDAFARAEAAIDGLLRNQNLVGKGELVSAKLERLRKLKSSSAYSVERKQAIDAVLVEIAALLPIRNDLAHATMIVRKEGEQAIACFANPNLACSYSRVSREIAAPRLQALAARTNHLAMMLETA